MSHEVQFTLTGCDLPALEHLADAKAEDYFGPDLEPLLTRSRAVPNTNPANGVSLDGWRVTFRYRSRPRLEAGLAADGLSHEPEFDITRSEIIADLRAEITAAESRTETAP